MSLHLWLLRAPAGADSGSAEDPGVLLADAAASQQPAAGREGGVGWEALSGFVRSAVDAFGSRAPELPDGARRVAVIDLLDDEVDLTPGRHVSAAPGGGNSGWRTPGAGSPRPSPGCGPPARHSPPWT